MVDGASRFQRIVHIDLPNILPTAVALFILQAWRMMDVGFGKVFFMQNPLNMKVSEVASTYACRVGFLPCNRFYC